MKKDTFVSIGFPNNFPVRILSIKTLGTYESDNVKVANILSANGFSGRNWI